MATVSETIVARELEPLFELAKTNNWIFKKLGPLSFVLGLPAKDGEFYFSKCDCSGYPEDPPCWEWSNQDGKQYGLPSYCPEGSGYFHGSGVICAPWNRLAYKDKGGPHGDWSASTWRQNEKTNGCNTLAHMVLRISVELMSSRYLHRKEKAA